MVIYKYLKKASNKPLLNTWSNSREETPKDYIGFVYEIYDKKTKLKYIGLTRYWIIAKYPPLKGKKNKRHFLKESDWRNYNGSGVFSDIVKEDPNRFTKNILKECKSITELKCSEAYIQLSYYINDNWDQLSNEMINIRLRIRKND